MGGFPGAAIMGVAKNIENQNFKLYNAVQGVMKDHIQSTNFISYVPIGNSWRKVTASNHDNVSCEAGRASVGLVVVLWCANEVRLFVHLGS